MSEDVTAGQVPVCAIGASAGGVEALRSFFTAIAGDLGLAYVVIVHLSPEHPSQLAEILASCTTMTVRQVDDSPTLAPDCVYVIAPDRELVIDGDDVRSRPFTEPRGARAPIDMFFRSVAQGRGDGFAVVLSGAGSDGAGGVKAIKEAGGVVFVQDPAEAEYPMMPRSAMATGVADFVIPVKRMTERIAEVAASKRVLKRLDVDGAGTDLKRIVAFLRQRTGHDFSQYKSATLLRRITRRMQVKRFESTAEYADYVRDTPEEAQELFSDLLISVTMFFRDRRAFEILEEEAIRPIFDRAGEDGEIRAWVAGCATGEEAYSLAILFIEEARRRQVSVPIQIFATDLDEGAIATAREGRYPASIAADVSEERLKRFFTREGAHYRVKQEVRDVVLFALHSVLKDPPFMRLELVTCRNLLIYLERELQRQVRTLFHYGLKDRGYLFLGSAETADDAPGLFAPVNREARIYVARATAHRTPLMLPQPPGERPIVRRERDRPRLEVDRGGGAAHVAALEDAAPPSALVDRQHHVMHLSPNAGRFILMSAGAVSAELPLIVRPELRVDLKVALNRAFEKGEPTLTPATPVAFDGTRRRVVMQVTPETTEGDGPAQALVFFLDGGAIAAADDVAASTGRPDGMRRLHEELRAAQERLSASRSDHEAAVQELRAANEELQSINEEYRSTSEELETSKEELQSINEELRTVNSELKAKLEIVSSAHSDLKNLIDSTEIGTLFLDNELRIRMFTPRVADIFSITEADAGRAITDFTNRLMHAAIDRDATALLRDLKPAEQEVATLDGQWLMMRMRPYRTIDDRIDGVVVTFIDVTAVKTATEKLRDSEEKYRALFETMSEGMIVAEPLFDADGRASDIFYHEANPAARALVSTDFVGHRLNAVMPGFEPEWWEIPARVLRTGETERHVLQATPLRRWFEVTVWKSTRNPRWIELSFRDVSEQRHAERALAEAEARQRALIEGVPQLVWRASREGRWTWSSPQWARYTGLSAADSRDDGWLRALHPDDHAVVAAAWAEAGPGRPLMMETRIWDAAERRYRWFQTRAAGVLDETGGLVEWIGASTDVDDLRALQEQQRVMVAELQHRTRNLIGVVRSIATQTLASAQGLDDFSSRFGDRLNALSRVQGLLSRSGEKPTTLDALVRMELDALGVDDVLSRVAVAGPDVVLRSASVQTLALGLHELATNARKYGALASDSGELSVTWRIDGSDGEARLVLVWLETNVAAIPAAKPRDGAGYGRTLIEKALPYALGATTSFELAAGTVRCVIDLPLARIDKAEQLQ